MSMNPIAGGDDLHVVLNDDHRVAGANQVLQLALEPLHVGWMEPGGGLVKHIERVAALSAL